MGDKLRYMQILLNFLTNAVKFTRVGQFIETRVILLEVQEIEDSDISDKFGIANFIKNSEIVLGNSSSGIIEAPSLKTLTLNIGERQKGRIFAKSVYQCALDENEILKKINFLLNSPKINFQNIFYKKNTSENIYKETKKFLTKKNINKKFYDFKKYY